jgi:hypothetical protein
MVAYLAMKLVAYAAWCLVALRATRGRQPGELGRAAGYGVARVVLGLALGTLLVIAMPSIAPAANRTHFSIPVYALALTLVRVFEWLAVGGFIAAGADARPGLGARVAWTAGGVALSSLTDVAGIAFGVAVGVMPC